MANARAAGSSDDLDGSLDPSLASDTPSLPSPKSSKLRLPNLGAPTRAAFEAATDDYIAGLHTTKQAKTVRESPVPASTAASADLPLAKVQQDMYDFILRALSNPSDTSNGTAIERHWVREKFKLGSLDGEPVPLRKSRNNTPCASRGMIYDIVLDSHILTGHGGRDKTFNHVKDRWSGIPKGALSLPSDTIPSF